MAELQLSTCCPFLVLHCQEILQPLLALKQDITTPFVMDDGYLTVPTGDGIGVTPDMNFLDSITISKEIIL